jgi:hypothetical protein
MTFRDDYEIPTMAAAFDDPAPDGTDLGAGGFGVAHEPVVERPAVPPAASAAAIDASEARRVAITKELIGGKLTDAQRAEKTRELQALVASQATDAEKGDIASASLETHRAAYGLAPPDLPKPWQEAYAEHHEGFEQDFLAAARERGLDKGLVVELRDTGVRLAVEADGKPLSTETWNALEKRFAGRLSPSQFTALRAWWRGTVEGQSA